MYSMFQKLFLRNSFLRNSLQKQNTLKKKSLIVIDSKLNIMDLKLKYIPFKERYEISISEVNEDFTSQAVSKEDKKQEYDSYSAALIFEEWFNQNNG